MKISSAQSWTLIKACVLALAFFLLFQKGQLDQIKQGFLALKLSYWLLGQLLFSLSICCLTLRWVILLKAFDCDQEHLGFWTYRFPKYYQALFFNTFIPGSVTGDLMRGYAHDQSTLKKSYAIILLERVIGLFTLGLLYLWLLFSPFGSLYLAGLLILSVLAIFCFFRLLVMISKSWLKQNKIILLRIDTLLFAMLVNLLSHGLMLLIYTMVCFKIGIALPIYPLLQLLVLAMLSSVIPISILGFGARELTMLSLFSLAHVDQSLSMTVVLVVYSMIAIQAFIGGLINMIDMIKR